MKKIIIFVIIIVILISVWRIKTGENEVDYNNIKSYDELITNYYSSKELQNIKNAIINKEYINLSDIIKEKEIECARHIENTRYVLLISEDGEKLFIFYNSDYFIIETYYVENNFLRKSNFDDVQEGKSTQSEIIAKDSSCFVSLFSTINATIHIVQEGVIVIIYDIMQDPIVESVTFYDNKDLLEVRESNMLVKIAPYILEIDKQ